MGQIIQSLKSVKFTNKNCLFEAVQHDGRTIEQILEDVEKEKDIELNVLNLYYKKDWGTKRTSSYLGITESKVKHIIKFDALGLSYRKINYKKL